jgi:hypothetical protein
VSGEHHRACPAVWGDGALWGDCDCDALRLADDAAADVALDCAYGLFYDPDFDSDPYAARESYGGWSRAHQGAHRDRSAPRRGRGTR